MIPPQEHNHGIRMAKPGVLYEIVNFCGFLIGFSFLLGFSPEFLIVFYKFPVGLIFVFDVFRGSLSCSH